MLSMEYRGAYRTIWSPYGAQFGGEFGEVYKYSASSLRLIPNRFWNPGRGQNGTGICLGLAPFADLLPPLLSLLCRRALNRARRCRGLRKLCTGA
jgi:hypothetical protein